MTFRNASYRHILSLAIPIMVGGVAQNVILATDAFFMARVDETSLDAVGLAGLFFSTLYILGFGFSTGVQILIARRHGEKEHTAIGTIFRNSLLFMLLLSLVLWAAMEWLAAPVLRNLIHSEGVYRSAVEYLDYRAWGITLALVSLTFRAFYIGISSSLVTTWAVVSTAVLNVFLNYVLIFGKWGAPAMGIAGSGLASSLAEIAGIACFMIYTRRKKIDRLFALFGKLRWDGSVMKRVLNISSPVMLQYFLSHAGWFLFFIFIERLGERALAISVIIRIIYMFQMVPFWGLSSATNTLVSYAIGEGRKNDVFPVLYRVTLLAVLCSLLFVIPNLLVPEWIIGLAVENNTQQELITASVPTLYIISVSLLLFAIAMTFFSGVTGSGNTRIALLIEIITITLYVMLAAFLSWHSGERDVHVVWLTEIFYFACIGLAAFGYMRSGRWKQARI